MVGTSGGRAMAAITLTVALALVVGGTPWDPGDTGRTVALAQDDQSATVDVLLRATIQEAPPAPAFLRLLRITLEPGASIPAHTHPGPELDRVESGTVSIAVPDGAQVLRADAAPDAAPEVVNAEEELELGSGDQVAFPTGNGMRFANTGTEDATLLAAVVLPAGSQRPAGVVYTDGTPSDEDFTGVRPSVLGDGTAAAMPDGEVVVLVERLTLADGDPIPAAPGPVLLSLETGALAFTAEEGQVQISRTAQPGPQPNITLGTLVELTPGDAAFFSVGMAEVDRPDGSGDLELLRMSILPANAGAATPAPDAEGVGVLSFEEASTLATVTVEVEPDVTPEATDEPGDGTDGAGFSEGDRVVVTEDEVRLRAEPSTDAEIVSGLDQGAVLEITGPPEEGGDLVWYPVVDPNDLTLAGFVVEDFLEPEEAE